MSSHFSMDKCMAAEAMVSVEVVRTLLDYDPDIGHLIWRKRLNRNFNSKYAGTIAGAKHRSGAIQIQLTTDLIQRLFWAHRIAWAHFHGYWPLGLIDHRDGNPTNNCIQNLRLADGSQNGANKRELRGAIALRGVYQWKDGRYAAQIKCQGKWEWLGLYEDALDAARAYDSAAVRLHGEFAVTNVSMGLFKKYAVEALA